MTHSSSHNSGSFDRPRGGRGGRDSSRGGAPRGGDGRRGGPRRGDFRRGGERGGHSRRESGERQGYAPRARVSTSPRVAAFDVLLEVIKSDAYANLILPPLLRERRIFGRDAGFATELTYGTLRMQGQYDAIIEAASDRKIADLDIPVVVALRLGVHQLLSMRVPPHAAVSETVALAREKISAGPAQLVNAVLRRVSEKTAEEWLEEIAQGESDSALAITHSHPEWIVRAFSQALRAYAGNNSEESTTESLARVLAANNEAPFVHLVMRPGMANESDLDELEVTPGTYARTARYLSGGDPMGIHGLRSGDIGVQDEGSQLVTLAALNVDIEGSDDTWIDLCAGPGGKAALMASVMADRGGGSFVANELHEHRTGLVRQNLKSIPETVTIQTVTGDGTEVGTLEPGKYDRVLIDAPCTGLGALRRRPESRWRRQPSDLPDLTTTQRGLLISGLEAVRVGGVVAYITCSPHVAETRLVVEDAIRAVNKNGIETEIIDATEHLNAVSRTPVQGQSPPFVQLWPHEHGTDGMFLALIRRTA